MKCFRPSGAAFHDLVALEALTGADEALRELRLLLARSFIDDPRNGAFALDITKSFLSSALGSTPVILNFERRLAQGVDIRRTNAAHHERVGLSGEEDGLLQAYAGSKTESEMRCGALTLRLKNELQSGVLIISLT
jgi:hypothetical protein